MQFWQSGFESFDSQSGGAFLELSRWGDIGLGVTGDLEDGDPNGIRTRVTPVKGECPNHWTIGSFRKRGGEIVRLRGWEQGLIEIFKRNFRVEQECGVRIRNWGRGGRNSGWFG